jgi:hypothetical protein
VGHRFVKELFAGTVPDAVIARHLIQDHRFLDSFLTLLGAALASADTFEARLRFGRFIGTVSSEENTYFLRAFEALGVTEDRRAADTDTQPTTGFKAIMREAAQARSYAAALSVLVVTEWLYLDWASRYDRDLADIFAVQDEITEAVTIAIAPAIADAEQQRAMRKPQGSLDRRERSPGGPCNLSGALVSSGNCQHRGPHFCGSCDGVKITDHGVINGSFADRGKQRQVRRAASLLSMRQRPHQLISDATRRRPEIRDAAQ